MFLVKKTEPTAGLCFEKTINFVKNWNKSKQKVHSNILKLNSSP